MSLFSTTTLALSMSADAFAAAVGKGAVMQRPNLKDAASVGLIFAAVETATPVIGWLAGMMANSLIADYDHWVAFTILLLLGIKMLIESVQPDREKPCVKDRLGILVLTAIGTSIDAMAVGVTLAILNVGILISALAIGLATFFMTTIGIMAGHYIGSRGGRIAEALGGASLILIGAKILFEHLGAAGV